MRDTRVRTANGESTRRECLSLEAGGTVDVSVEDGRVVLRPRVSRESFIETMDGCITDERRAPDPEPPDPLDLKTNTSGIISTGSP